MGQVLLLIITDMQLERQKVWKNPDLPLGGMTAGRKAERTMPDFLLRDCYSLMNWNRTLELPSAEVKSLGWTLKIHARLWASKGQLRLECSERLFLFSTEILLEDVWATEKQNLFPSGMSAPSSSQTLCFRDPSLSCFAKERQQQLHDCSCSEGSTSWTLHFRTLATGSYIWCFLNRSDSWQCSRNNETQKIKHVGGLSAAKPWDPKEKSGLPAEFTGKKDSTNIWIGGRIKMQNGFELTPSTW